MMSCCVCPESFAAHPSRSHTSLGIFTVETVSGTFCGPDEYGRDSSSLTADRMGSEDCSSVGVSRRGRFGGDSFTWHLGRNYVRLDPGKSHMVVPER